MNLFSLSHKPLEVRSKPQLYYICVTKTKINDTEYIVYDEVMNRVKIGHTAIIPGILKQYNKYTDIGEQHRYGIVGFYYLADAISCCEESSDLYIITAELEDIHTVGTVLLPYGTLAPAVVAREITPLNFESFRRFDPKEWIKTIIP